MQHEIHEIFGHFLAIFNSTFRQAIVSFFVRVKAQKRIQLKMSMLSTFTVTHQTQMLDNEFSIEIVFEIIRSQD